MLAQGSDIEDSGGLRDSTSLGAALCGGHEEVVRLLIKQKADVLAKAKDGSTPLHYAALHGLAVARLLLQHGADVSAKRNDLTTLLHWASHQGNTELGREKEGARYDLQHVFV